MYRNIPELIQAGVHSFKIEGRMRPAEFIRRIVRTYRKAIDSYIADPFGYQTDEAGWQDLFANRARDFTTTFALGPTTARDIGFDGKREPRFFSEAVKEPGFQDDILKAERSIARENAPHRRLSVRVGDIEGARAAIESGADAVYVGGEAFRPKRPWRLTDIEEIIEAARQKGAEVLINTPRTTMRRECGELEQFFTAIDRIQPAGILVSNLGSLRLAQTLTKLPVHADLSFNIFNHLAAKFLKENGLSMATASLELSFEQLRSLVEASALPIEVIVHGSYESMILDHNLPEMSLGGYDPPKNPEFLDRHYALRDKAGEVHAIRIDQFGRNHLYFAKDLCLYPYLEKFSGIASYRIEAQDYAPELVALVTKTYRAALDALSRGENAFDEAALSALAEKSPRALGVGVYRFRESKDSI